ncbi:MAG: hypothetical protein GWN01_00695 [Nitrosopumilaceae archaeon]|nr:hypothetical protein [Nitrosopumilaceae archaeon]NIT99498.1 hypothetical protein [Nitrosopumilaceae archaeon]NIU85857.1 hypothetical protein [Nitrosopumilaceae archaeon]NIV64714.1 hypothetical protein [Nitrosopumilaceae archaeon]NIX60101.1 hypothetical protein [Nitrosopumilaceae archaeon]
MKNNKKFETIGLTIFSCVIIFLGILDGIEFSKGLIQLYNYEISNNYPNDSDYDYKLSLLTMQFFLMLFLFWLGGKTLITLHFSQKQKKIVNQQRKQTEFQTKFSFYLLIIAVLISFSVQSMNDNRHFWMFVWGGSSIILTLWLWRYRNKKLNEIFDNDQDILK